MEASGPGLVGRARFRGDRLPHSQYCGQLNGQYQTLCCSFNRMLLLLCGVSVLTLVVTQSVVLRRPLVQLLLIDAHTVETRMSFLRFHLYKSARVSLPSARPTPTWAT